MISKNLIFTISDFSKLHKDFQNNIKSLSELNKDWNVEVFDTKKATSFLNSNYGEFFSYIYNLINPELQPARSDFFQILKNFFRWGFIFRCKIICRQTLERNIV